MDSVRSTAHKAIADLALTFAGGYPLVVEYDNREVTNTKTQVDPYLQVNLMFIDGYQRDLSDAPYHRLTGQLQLLVSVPRGSGSAKAYQLLEHFYRGLQRRRIGPSLFFMSTMLSPRIDQGRMVYGVGIPFQADVPS